MKCTVFYSWQSDLPNATNRGFIETALEHAAKSIRNDESILIEPVIDRDTAGVPGSPDIAMTILSKIDNAQVFVCDVSLINQDSPGRSSPNPNVLIELGYAMKSLGPEHVVMVLNTAYGGPELLPFDLRMRRVISYAMPEAQEDRATERKRLEILLAQGLRTILEGLEVQQPGQLIQPRSIAEETQIAVRDSRPDQQAVVRRFMSWVSDELDALAPDFSSLSGNTDEFEELLIQAIDRSCKLVTGFASVAEAIAETNAAHSAVKLYQGFESILECYEMPRDRSSKFHTVNGNVIECDFHKFMGHELFVTFFSFLLRDERWDIITDLLGKTLYVQSATKPVTEQKSFEDVSWNVQLLESRSKRLNRISSHADLLNERHSKGDLSQIVPMRQFVDTDYFLYLRSQLAHPDEDRGVYWYAWSTLYMSDQTPRFLTEALENQYAQNLLPPLNLEDIQSFRNRFAERAHKLSTIFGSSVRYGGLPHLDQYSIATS
jgi:hypothetical protein